MSILSIVTDSHFGGKNDVGFWRNYTMKFWVDYWNFVNENQIKYMIHDGDVLDRRKFINYLSLKYFREMFLDELEESSVEEVHFVVGNHDTYFKNTNEVNALDLLISDRKNLSTKIFIHEKPTTVNIDGVDIDIVPWIANDDHYEMFENIIQNSRSTILFGHLEVSGFGMYKGIINKGGLNKDIFSKYDMVCSGHFHHKSSYSNVNYLGAPYEITWSDYDDPRGFHTLDLKTRELKFHQNHHHLFEKILYDDKKGVNLNQDFTKYKDKIVKLIIVNRENFTHFEYFVEQLEKSGVIDLKISEDYTEYLMSFEEEEFNPEDTLDVLNNYVEGLTVKDNEKENIKERLNQVYVEAMNRE